MTNTIRKQEQKPAHNSMSGFSSLAFYYEEAKTKYIDDSYSIWEIFSQNQAEKFIGRRFKQERKNKKIKSCIDRITPFRAIHTVSSFLLGLTVRDKLHFDTRSWRRLPGEKSSKGSFELFWSWICLFHDIGYYYETAPDKFATHKTISGLMNALKINYSMLDGSEYRELIEKYYAMRINAPSPKVDHGIVGALLLYDALMNLAENYGIYSEIRDYKSFYVKVCDTIALHNMWRATDSTGDLYKKFNLIELIPSDDLHHVIYYKENPFLFLLALVDTVDPIKNFCRDNRHRHAISATDVLDNVYLQFSAYSGNKQLNIMYDNPAFDDYVRSISAPYTGLSSWLGLYTQSSVTQGFQKKLSLSIDLKDYSSLKDISA